MMRPCLRCGELASGSYCEEHAPVKASAKERGYTYAWSRLSKRCREIQPWCLDCGSEQDLSLDHTTPAAWEIAKRRPLTLKDAAKGLVVVRCMECNNKAGKARGYGVKRAD
ncbi:MAG: hypothetical protein JST91_29690 [Actinobacteria bacterium]|nr:hypothetical protein [Actinomycetota bacterium]